MRLGTFFFEELSSTESPPYDTHCGFCILRHAGEACQECARKAQPAYIDKAGQARAVNSPGPAECANRLTPDKAYKADTPIPQYQHVAPAGGAPY